jgi:hypothetical protein
MAKEKRSAADLDAELAALEAELAALEGKPKKKTEKPKKAPVAPLEAAARAQVAAAPEPRSEKKRFGLPAFGKKKSEPERAPVPAFPPTTAPVQALAQAPSLPSLAPAPIPRYDSSVWRQEGDVWVRVVPETPVPVVRRVLDENGGIVREEPAHARDVADVSSVKAERGLGRLLRRG